MATSRGVDGSGPIGRSPTALVRRGDFGVVVLGRHDERPIALAGTGVSVWDALDRPRSLADVVGELADRFGADAATVRADVEPLVAELLRAGVLEQRS